MTQTYLTKTETATLLGVAPSMVGRLAPSLAIRDDGQRPKRYAEADVKAAALAAGILTGKDAEPYLRAKDALALYGIGYSTLMGKARDGTIRRALIGVNTYGYHRDDLARVKVRA